MYFIFLALAAAGSSLAEMSSGLDNERLCLIKRGPFFQQITPCTCPTGRDTLLDLGSNHVPRYLANLNCERVPCYRPPFYCTGLPYKVRVLRRRKISDEDDMSVPETLRGGWRFVDVNINVGCVCNESNMMKRSLDGEKSKYDQLFGSP